MSRLALLICASLLVAACGRHVAPPLMTEPKASVQFAPGPLDGDFDLEEQNKDWWHPEGCQWDGAVSTATIAGSGTETALIMNWPDCFVSSSPVPLSPTAHLLTVKGQSSALREACAQTTCVAVLVRTYTSTQKLMDREVCYVGPKLLGTWEDFACSIQVTPGMTHYTVTVMGPPAPTIPIAVRRLSADIIDASTAP